jgi:hypothetical protein
MKAKPRKKGKPTKKVERFNPKESADIANSMQQTMALFFQEKLKNRDSKRKNIESLSSVIEEFLASYVILGYTLDGTPVHIVSAHNQQEADSLTVLFNKFIHNCLTSGEDNKD